MEEAKKLHIKSIIWHNNIVVNLMVLLENNKNKFPFKINDWELVRRAVRHDFDKFEDNHSNALSYYYF
ncbi:MAG: hypothetical protein LBT02_02635, partial [Rickettsiales bacterium]|nr:hypothetical protein [Rickettsiales bacterium]